MHSANDTINLLLVRSARFSMLDALCALISALLPMQRST